MTDRRTARPSSGASERSAHARCPECGFVLAAVIFALVVIEILVAGAFVLGMYEQRLGWNMVAFQQARGVAEHGVTWRLAEWDSASYEGLAVGDSASFSGSPRFGSGRYEGSVIRLGNWMFLVRARGFSRSSEVRGEHALLVRVDSSGPAPVAQRGAVLPF